MAERERHARQECGSIEAQMEHELVRARADYVASLTAEQRALLALYLESKTIARASAAPARIPAQVPPLPSSSIVRDCKTTR